MLKPSQYASFLKRMRKEAELTQEELGYELQLTQSNISKYESGRKIIDLETFMKWMQVTNAEVQAAMILFGTDVITTAADLVTTLQFILW